MSKTRKPELSSRSRRTVVLIIIVSLLLVLFVVSIAYILITPMAFSKIVHDYPPQNLETYYRNMSESDGFIARTNQYYFDIGDDWSFPSTRWQLLRSRDWSAEELALLAIPNQGFEDSDGLDSKPRDWQVIGSASYSRKKCSSGRRCLFVDVDDSPYGYLLLNSKPIAINGLYNYTFSFDINCVRCDNESAYLTIIWQDNKPGGEVSESIRYVKFLESTDGYERVTINARAPPDSVRAVVGLRVHTEATSIQPRTTLYIDAPQ
jgi:hypothetical protein